ncbi:hypothetical protein [Chondromyces apiculatus]|nr:hypothetical protein [Chondromyces apiculatus]
MSKKVIDRAVPVLTEPSDTAAARIAAGAVHITALQGSPDWAASPEVQAATSAWLAENESLATVTSTIADLENQLAIARATQRTQLRRWDAHKRAVLSAVETACDGSKDKVQRFGMGVATRTAAPTAVTPEDLRAKRSTTPGVASAVWATRRGHHGFLVQHATNPEDPATFSAPLMSARGKFDLAGQRPGTTVYCRVLALDPDLPNGQTDYTSWVAMTVST